MPSTAGTGLGVSTTPAFPKCGDPRELGEDLGLGVVGRAVHPAAPVGDYSPRLRQRRSRSRKSSVARQAPIPAAPTFGKVAPQPLLKSLEKSVLVKHDKGPLCEYKDWDMQQSYVGTRNIDSRRRFAKAKLLRSHDRRRRCDYSEVRTAPWMPDRAAITRSMRAGSATRRGSGARRRRRSTGIEPAEAGVRPRAGVYGRWFVGGVCNTCCNAVDRHVDAGRGEQPAIIYDSPLAGQKRTHHLSPRCRPRRRCSPPSCATSASSKGDRVVIYMPMVPEAVIGMLACARIGAVHSVVFGGFAANELATRIDDAKPKVILSASCGLEPGRIVKYKPLLDEAIRLSTHKPDACLILQRPQAEAALVAGRDHDWAKAARRRARLRQLGLRLRAGRGDRSALHPLHLGHDRAAQGRGARQWRPHGRAQMVDEEPLRRRAGRGVLGGLRRRLGGRPQLHRLWAAAPRLHLDPLRRASPSARPTPARSGA